jgi:hypothetical protein
VAPTDIPIGVKNRFPHITLSCAPQATKDSLYGPVYANTLLERLYEAVSQVLSLCEPSGFLACLIYLYLINSTPPSIQKFLEFWLVVVTTLRVRAAPEVHGQNLL